MQLWQYCLIVTARLLYSFGRFLRVLYSRLGTTHTPQVQNYAAKHQPSTRQNICEPLRVISVKHSSVFPDDGSRKIRNMSE